MGRPPHVPTASFKPDGIWGTVFVVLYTGMLAATIAYSCGSHDLGVQTVPPTDEFGRHFGRAEFAAMAMGEALIFMIGIALSAVLVAQIRGAVGIRRGERWGFWLTIWLSVVSLVLSCGWAFLTVVPLIYSILRLSGGYGPKPH